MSGTDSARLARLAEGLSHIHVEPRDGSGDKFFKVIATAEPSWPAPHSLWVTWLYANLKAGRVHIHFLDPHRRAVSAPVKLKDFKQILRNAEKAIQVGNTAEEIALERAAEILDQKFRPNQAVFTALDTYEAKLLFKRHYGADRYSLVIKARNMIQLDGGWVVHVKSVTIELYAFHVSDEEVELLRQLAEDLAEIFDAPKLKEFRKVEGLFISSVGAQAEVWSATSRLHLVHPPVSDVPSRSTGR